LQCSDEKIDDSILVDMKLIKADPYLPKDLEVIGYAYDGATGKVREVAVM
jgi:carbonic anhydrase